MSLVERLFPASELAALKQAVLSATADDQQQQEPAAKRRKVERQNSSRSRYSTDSGYNSDESTHQAWKKPMTRQQPTTQAASPAASQSDEEDYCEKIAQARARLYSNASLSLSLSTCSPPSSSQGDVESPRENFNTAIFDAASPTIPEEYHSPVSVESLADTTTSSGCGLGAFISLGLAVTGYERNLLTSFIPEPAAMPNYYNNAEVHARKLQWLQRRRAAVAMMKEQQRQRSQSQGQTQRQTQTQTQQGRRTSYQGFVISTHDDEVEVDEQEQQQNPSQQSYTADSNNQKDGDIRPQFESPERIDDFFNIDAASEEEAAPGGDASL